MTPLRKGQRRISEDQARNIRRDVLINGMTLDAAIAKHQVSESTIRRACGGSTIMGRGPESWRKP